VTHRRFSNINSEVGTPAHSPQQDNAPSPHRGPRRQGSRIGCSCPFRVQTANMAAFASTKPASRAFGLGSAQAKGAPLLPSVPTRAVFSACFLPAQAQHIQQAACAARSNRYTHRSNPNPVTAFGAQQQPCGTLAPAPTPFHSTYDHAIGRRDVVQEPLWGSCYCSRACLSTVVLCLPLISAALGCRRVCGRVSRGQRLAVVAQAAASKYDYDLVIIGCGVGGHGAALHAVEQVSVRVGGWGVQCTSSRNEFWWADRSTTKSTRSRLCWRSALPTQCTVPVLLPLKLHHGV
jgi:hypothetical protein